MKPLVACAFAGALFAGALSICAAARAAPEDAAMPPVIAVGGTADSTAPAVSTSAGALASAPAPFAQTPAAAVDTTAGAGAETNADAGANAASPRSAGNLAGDVSAHASAVTPEHAADAAANRAAGLPDLDALNKSNPAAAHATVEVNSERTPSFYSRDKSGTVIEEYRDKGKPVEIDVQSNFGTRYQMSAPIDISPQMQNSGPQPGRLPSIKLTY